MKQQQETVLFPPEKGSYLLVAKLRAAVTAPIGKSGSHLFTAGWYLYCGSAHGSGGLRARLRRHIRAEKKLHWHIDYLLPLVTLAEARWVPGRIECAAAEQFRQAGGAVAVPGFGAGDCRCSGHLLWFPDKRFTPLAEKLYPGSARL